MKKIGIIKDFDGYNGKVESLDGIEYNIYKKDICYQNINKFDSVSFVPEEYNKPEYKTNIARFVKKIERNLMK